VFRENDIGDKLFLVIKGNVSFYKLEPRVVEMTGEKYCQYLKNKLIKEKDEYSVKLALEANESVFDVDFDDIRRYEEILFLILYKDVLMSIQSYEALTDILRYINIGIDIFGQSPITECEEDRTTMIKSMIERFYKSKMIVTELAKYSFLAQDLAHKVKIFENKGFLTQSTNSHFGAYALDVKNSKRSATVIADTDCIFGTIDGDIYRSFIYNDSIKQTLKDISFLIESFFFTTYSSKVFRSKYYQLFLHEEKKRGEIIIKEKSNFEHVYFIKSGEIELTISCSLIEIMNIINLFVLKEVAPQPTLHSNAYLIKTNKDYFNQKKKYKVNSLSKLLIVMKKDIIGLEELFLKSKCIITATVKNEAKYFLIQKQVIG
jgi:CRP-like cAMP-binding protein